MSSGPVNEVPDAESPSGSIRVAVSGAGKMGQEIVQGLYLEPDVEPVAVLDKFSDEDTFSLPSSSGQRIPRSNDPALLQRLRPDVLIDFSHHEWTEAVAPLAVDLGIHLVIGTTGLSDAFVAELDHRCREAGIGGVIAANFAIGAVLLMHLAQVAAPFFENVEVIELHHDQKVDAPSGTALTTVRGLLAARDGRPFAYPETAKQTLPNTRGGEFGGAGIHSIRLPGLVAHQEVIFGGLGQTLTLRHDTSSRESFLPGVMRATHQVMRLRHLVHGLDQLLGLRA